MSAQKDHAARQASGSSFYAGMRILPREKREAMYAVYAFCRAVDDIADGDAAVENPQAAMAEWRRAINALYTGGEAGEAAFLKPVVQRYRLDIVDFLAVIDGMEMDLHGPIVAPDEATLDLYCDRVASAVGRLSSPIFGLEKQSGVDLAYHLGRALQLTNIVRDIDEDAMLGRLYLPRECLTAAGITSCDPKTVVADPAIGVACAPLIARAKNHFSAANAVMDQSPAKSVKAPRLMASGYGDVLRRVEKRGFAPPRRRIGVNKWRMVGALARWGLFK